MNKVTNLKEWKQKQYKETGLTKQQIKNIDKYYEEISQKVEIQDRRYNVAMADYVGWYNNATR